MTNEENNSKTKESDVKVTEAITAGVNAEEVTTAQANAAATATEVILQDNNEPGCGTSEPDKTQAATKTFIYHNEKLLLPKYDLVFKAIFGSERSKSVLAAFLTDVLDLQPLAPDELTIMNNESLSLNHQNKDCRLDVRVLIRETTQINIEIHLRNDYSIVDRSVFYTADMLSRQLPSADDNSEARPVIELCILDFKQFNDNRLFHFSSIFDEETGELISKKLRIAYLELPKLETLDSTQADEPRVQWARFIAADNQEVLDKLAYTNKNIEEAVSILREASADPKLLYDYEMRIKGENDRIAALATARKRGERRGQERGKRQKQLEIACKMLKTGLDIANICQCTGLTEQEILEIAELLKE